MTSKECLEILVDKTGIMNDTCARLDKCLKCGKCQIDDEPVETCDDYNLVMTIKKDLERLEKLEKEHYDTLKSWYKLKKVIEILKENFEIALHYDDNEFPTPMISVDGSYSYINKQEYELIKEGLDND